MLSFFLTFFLRLRLGFRESFGNELDFSNDIALSIKDFTLVIDLLPDQVRQLAFRDPSNGLAVFVDDFTLLVNF